MHAVSKEAASQNAHGQVHALLRAHLSSGAVLDAPCGSGAFLRRLLAGPYRACGLDVAHHEAVPEEAEFVAADMNEPLPYVDAHFDAVVSIEGIEHLRRPFDFVGECARVLRPGGLLILTTPNISSLRSRWRWFLTGFHNKGKYPLDENNPQPRHHINLLSYPELRYMLHTAGLRIEAIETNRVKVASWLYLPALPLAWVATRRVMHGGARRKPEMSGIYGEVAGAMFSKPVCFGETLILIARKTAEEP